MANSQAIGVVCEAIIQTLSTHAQTIDFGINLEFEVYTEENFLHGMDTGVSLFLYRIKVNGTHRNPGGYISQDGRYNNTQLPIDLHFLLTVWGGKPKLQQYIAGWMMRVLEDNPILPASVLNFSTPQVFRDDEIVEIFIDDLSTENMLHIWETFLPKHYQLSIPYIARNIKIESTQIMEEVVPIRERLFEYHKMPDQFEAS